MKSIGRLNHPVSEFISIISLQILCRCHPSWTPFVSHRQCPTLTFPPNGGNQTKCLIILGEICIMRVAISAENELEKECFSSWAGGVLPMKCNAIGREVVVLPCFITSWLPNVFFIICISVKIHNTITPPKQGYIVFILTPNCSHATAVACTRHFNSVACIQKKATCALGSKTGDPN